MSYTLLTQITETTLKWYPDVAKLHRELDGHGGWGHLAMGFHDTMGVADRKTEKVKLGKDMNRERGEKEVKQ